MTNANKSWVWTSRNFLARQRLRVADYVSIDLYVAALVILTCRRLRTNYWNNLNYYPPRLMTYQIIRRAQSPLSFYTLLYLELILMRAWEVREDCCVCMERELRVCEWKNQRLLVPSSGFFYSNLQHLKNSLISLFSFFCRFYFTLRWRPIVLLVYFFGSYTLAHFRFPLKHNFYSSLSLSLFLLTETDFHSLVALFPLMLLMMLMA